MFAWLENCQSHQHSMTAALGNTAIGDPEDEDEISLTFSSLPRSNWGKPLHSGT